MNHPKRVAAAIAVLAAAGLAACGGGGDKPAKTTAKKPPAVQHRIKVVWDQPRTQAQAAAEEILKLGGTQGVADGFSRNFKLPVDLTIHAQAGPGSPFYDPQTKTVNIFYDFVDTSEAIIRHGEPGISDTEFGTQIAAIDGFILVHELGHAFVDVFGLPITGREEDAVDGLATVFMTDAVKNGLQYAFDTARFFKLLQSYQGAPDVQQFQDEHSLSVQRAYDIVCHVGGADPAALQDIAQRGILSQERLQRCPAEYQQLSRSWKTLLKPHLRTA